MVATLWGLALMAVDGSAAGPVPMAVYIPSLLAYAAMLGWAGWRRPLRARRITTANSERMDGA